MTAQPSAEASTEADRVPPNPLASLTDAEMGAHIRSLVAARDRARAERDAASTARVKAAVVERAATEALHAANKALASAVLGEGWVI